MIYQFLYVIVLGLLMIHPLYAQYDNALPHDECSGAQYLPLNEWLHEDNTEATLSDAQSRPAPYPQTCIPTYENDVWYFFESEMPEEYEIVIVHRICNTPSGLQAILMQSVDCNPQNYKIVACSSRKIADTIKIIFNTSAIPARYYLYVDGYGGTTCTYDVILRKQEGASLNPSNLKYNKFYQEFTPCTEALHMGAKIIFENNQPKITWKDINPEETGYFAIERILSNSGIRHYEQIGLIKPEQTALGYQDAYSVSDYKTIYKNDDDYAYRIVRYQQDGSKTCTGEIAGKAKVQNEFIVTEVEPTRQKGIYQVRYMIRKKQKYTMSILNDQLYELKGKPLMNTNVGEYTSNLDLSEYGPGVYYFRLASPTDYIIRKIEHY